MKNPHNHIIVIDPPIDLSINPSGDPKSRKWKCKYCGLEGTLHELMSVDCIYIYPPCKYCGKTPFCADNCPGIIAALTSPDVYVVGMNKPILPKC